MARTTTTNPVASLFNKTAAAKPAKDKPMARTTTTTTTTTMKDNTKDKTAAVPAAPRMTLATALSVLETLSNEKADADAKDHAAAQRAAAAVITKKLYAIRKTALIDMLARKCAPERTAIAAAFDTLMEKWTSKEKCIFLRHFPAYVKMIRYTLYGENMTLAIPRACVNSDIRTLDGFERNLINVIIPWQSNKVWTCTTKGVAHNAPATHAIAQGCFIEDKDGRIHVITPVIRIFPLPTKSTRQADGTYKDAPIVTFKWTEKATRVFKLARACGWNVESIERVLSCFGCPKDALDAAHKTLDSDTTSPKSTSKSTSKHVADAFADFF